MKILIVTEGFFPGMGYGGPPVSIDNFCNLLEDCQCYVIARNHDLGVPEPYTGIRHGWNDRGNCRVLYLSDDQYSGESFRKAVSDVRPDLIYLQSLFQKCIFPCLRLGKKFGIPVLLAPRGELCKGAFKKKYKKIPYIAVLRFLALLKGVYFQSTSREETQAIQKYLGPEDCRILLLSNIPSLPKERFSCSGKKAGEARFVFLSRIHPKKNLIHAIRSLRNAVGRVTLDIYGSLEDPAYWNLCLKETETLPDNVTVNYCGVVAHEEVHKVFSQYDAFLFPTFSENYGHVIIEALASGCPVIVSDRTPWRDLEQAGAGYVCSLEEQGGFEKAVQRVIDSQGNGGRLSAVAYAEKSLDMEKKKEEYTRALHTVCKRT